MKYYFYILFLIIVFQKKALSNDAILFSKEFDHIYLLESVTDGDDKNKYKFKIAKKYKSSKSHSDLANDRVSKSAIHAQESKRFLFGFKITPEVVWLYELDKSGNFIFEKKEMNQKKGKKYKLNISDL